MAEISFRTYDEAVLEKSWQWLNDEEIRNLIQAPIITKEEQLAWFHQLEHQSNYFVKGVVYRDQIIGVVGLKKINLTDKTAEYFGYIGEKEYWGKGIGREMISYIINYARKELNLNNIYLNVLCDNVRALKSYEKMGFIEIRREAQSILMIKEL